MILPNSSESSMGAFLQAQWCGIISLFSLAFLPTPDLGFFCWQKLPQQPQARKPHSEVSLADFRKPEMSFLIKSQAHCSRSAGEEEPMRLQLLLHGKALRVHRMPADLHQNCHREYSALATLVVTRATPGILAQTRFSDRVASWPLPSPPSCKAAAAAVAGTTLRNGPQMELE